MDRSHGVLCALWILGIVSCCLGQTLKCGEFSTSQAGTIMSPNFPSNYPDTVTCNWTITVASNQVITLRFHRFQVDLSDRVTFYDGNSTSRPVLNGYLSGYWEDARVSNVRIRTTGPSLHIVFTASGAPSGIGFSASYWAHECHPNTYGMDYCVNTCSCNQNNTLLCNNTSGECTCKSGWETATCDPCTFGYQCQDPFSDCFKKVGSNACECRQGLAINQSTGQCVTTCTPQQNQCSHACGVISTNPYKQQCYCPHGMKLDTANNRTCVECTGLSYGEDCKHQATCIRERTQMVNKINGSCTCYKNWTSTDCSKDFNECSLDVCNSTISSCFNYEGGYLCYCFYGYERVDEYSCRECGRIFTNSTGTITSNFYFPGKTPEVCWWTIIVAADNVIDLDFTYFYLYYTGSNGYVNVYDGANISAPLLRHIDGFNYHGGRLPGLIRSSGSTIHIVQYTGGFYSNGFKVYYTSHKCKEDFHGTNCSTPCKCLKNNTQYCDSITGECVCKPHWTSSDCTVDKNECLVNPLACTNYSECRNLQPGYECNCYLGLVKNTQGQCVVSNESSPSCLRSCSGLCVHMKTSGQEQCYCPIGKELVGDACINCHAGTFGPNCSFQCSCSKNNTVLCDPVTGHCECKPGWTSATCSQDIDECYFDSYKCPQESRCSNKPGDYECICNRYDGFENVDARNCTKMECHNTMTSPSGNLSSPNYPGTYYHGTNCTWRITAEQGNVISVRFDDFSTYQNYDYITFYNGDSVNDQIIGRYSGDINRTVPQIVRSVGNSMFITFTTQTGQTRQGFNAKYYTHPCPDFMYGLTCTETCRCNKTNTEYCENIKGECLCKLGWKGYTCIDDVSECLGINNFLCPPDSDCRNIDGNYTCICHQGFLKNTSSNLCDLYRNNQLPVSCVKKCYCARKQGALVPRR
ncbi:unnamed protein product [Lymnaea stagnalis]|uniref:CUB domain-containing protein n=1 Tax=Lymnaea stagnalis TaxID=6523 RepID=A0AAV2GYQ3_LYMST